MVRRAPMIKVIVAALGLAVTASVAMTHRTPRKSAKREASLLTGEAATARPAAPAHSARAWNAQLHQTSALPLFFEANAGQTDPRVRYLTRAAGYRLFVTPREAVFAIRPPRVPGAASAGVGEAARSAVVRLQFDGAMRARGAANLRVDAGETQLSDRPRPPPDGIVASLPTCVSLNGNLWPGIDLVYHGKSGSDGTRPEGRPPARIPRAIRSTLVGADRAEVDSSGTLTLSAAGRQLRLLKPGIYQTLDGARKAVGGGYVIHRAGHNRDAKPVYRIGFRLASYDKRRALIIDPVVTYAYVSYLGGSLIDIGDAVAVDRASGHIYVSGQTDSPDFPISANAYQKKCKGCVWPDSRARSSPN